MIWQRLPGNEKYLQYIVNTFHFPAASANIHFKRILSLALMFIKIITIPHNSS